MTDVLNAVLADLAAESDQIEAWVTPVDVVDWTTVTTPEGWTVSHQIAHLAWTDQASLTAIGGGEPFEAVMKLAINDPFGFVDAETDRWAAELAPAEQLLAGGRTGALRWPRPSARCRPARSCRGSARR